MQRLRPDGKQEDSYAPHVDGMTLTIVFAWVSSNAGHSASTTVSAKRAQRRIRGRHRSTLPSEGKAMLFRTSSSLA